MESKHYYFYVLYCADNTLYTGYTTDLKKRTKAHNTGKGAKYTKLQKRRPVRLIYAEERATRSGAMSAEAKFKQLTRLQKENYLKKNGLISFDHSPIILGLKEVENGTSEF